MTALLLAVALAADTGSVLEEVERLDRALLASEQELLRVAKAADEVRARAARAETELARARLAAAEAKERYTRRVRALARMPAGARLAVLGGSESFTEYLASSRLLRLVAKHDRSVQLDYLARADELKRLEAELSRERERLTQLALEERQRRDAAAAVRAEKFALLEAVLKDGARATAAVAELSRAARDLATMIQRLKPVSVTRALHKSRGQLPWPTAGKVRVAFGEVASPDQKTLTTHAGLDIAAPAGQRVQAVAPGTVVFAGWVKGYGQVVIVDHGDEYFTLSAHLGTLLVAEGDAVVAGTNIGTVGDTGSLRGALLYFELRHAGTALDPVVWLRR